VEFPYYASGIRRPDICAHCAAPDCQKDKELLKRFRVVLPVCNLCIASKKDIPNQIKIENELAF
jgi:hypothetical protein